MDKKKAIHLALLAVMIAVAGSTSWWQLDRSTPHPALAVEDAPPRRIPVDAYLRVLAESAWPDNAAGALNILHCESRTGLDPKAWRTDAPDGGPYQINRVSWETFFRDRYGWTWDQITHDPVINTQAARIIYDRTGDWSAWSCDSSTAATGNVASN
jgi:hypothetical protein